MFLLTILQIIKALKLMYLYRLILRSLFIVGLGFVLSACSTFDGEEDEGPAPLVDFEAQQYFKRVWSTSIGDGQGGIFNRLEPMVDGNTIYAAGADGTVKALSLDEGDRQWRTNLDQLLVGGVGVGEKQVYVGASSGEVIALDKASGDEVWRTQVGGEVLAAPQSNDTLVFVQTFDGQLLALAVEDGSRVWSYQTTVPVLTLRGTSRPLLFRNTVIAGFANGRVISFDMDTGKVRWNTRVAVATGDSEIERIIDVDGALLEVNNVIYATSYQGKVAAIDPASGRRLWSYDTSSHVGMSQGFNSVYVAGADGSVTAFETNGRGARWAQTVLARRKLSGSAILGSYVIVGDVEGYLHALSQVDGQIAARTRVDSDGIQADLQTVGDKLVVYGNSGKLAIYQLQDESGRFIF